MSDEGDLFEKNLRLELPRGRSAKPKTGSLDRGLQARWLTPEELTGDVWNPEGGILLGKRAGRLIGWKDNRHMLTIGGSRAGKGVSLIVPNLTFYKGSALVVDPKGENARITAGRRGQGTEAGGPGLGQTVHVIDPFGVSGRDIASFNPLSELNIRNSNVAEDAATFADALIEHPPHGERHWTESAQSILRALILVALAERQATVEGFSLISSFKYNRKGSMHAERLRYLEVTLCDWLFRAIDAVEVLPISRDYFRLRRPLDRRLYDMARKHCGAKEKWRISIDKLQKKCGSKQERKAFVRHLRETAEADHLPDYTLVLDDDLVVFLRKADGAGAARPALAAPHTAGPENANVIAETTKPASAASADRRILVSSKAIEQLYEFAPGWDKYMLEHAYIEWAKDKEAAHHEDARFLSWVKSYTKGKAEP